MRTLERRTNNLTASRVRSEKEGKKVRASLISAFLFISAILAHAQLCGPDVKHSTKRLDGKSPLETNAPPDKAVVYVIAPTMEAGPHYQVKISADRKWIGINQNHTYFVAALEPGEHDFCAKYRDDVGHLTLTLEAGKTYFLHQELNIVGVVRTLPILQKVTREDADVILEKCKCKLMEFAEKK
jgi:hypothetical protein